MREVVLDIETTGIFVDAGEKIISVGVVELEDGVPTGKTYDAYVNPGRDSQPGALKAHRLTTEFLSGFPPFAAIAQDMRDFIGDSNIIFTCRTTIHNGKPYTMDKEFVETEMKAAGVTPPRDEQWINTRRWGEAMFGDVEARLDHLLDRYGIDRTERDEKGHGALLDAWLLAAVYPRLKKEYGVFCQTPEKPASKFNP